MGTWYEQHRDQVEWNEELTEEKREYFCFFYFFFSCVPFCFLLCVFASYAQECM